MFLTHFTEKVLHNRVLKNKLLIDENLELRLNNRYYLLQKSKWPRNTWLTHECNLFTTNTLEIFFVQKDHKFVKLTQSAHSGRWCYRQVAWMIHWRRNLCIRHSAPKKFKKAFVFQLWKSYCTKGLIICQQ